MWRSLARCISAGFVASIAVASWRFRAVELPAWQGKQPKGRRFSWRTNVEGMKRNPGAWLRERLLDRSIVIALLVVMGIGWLCGAGLALWVVFGARLLSEAMAWLVLLPGVGLLGMGLYSAKRGWRLRDMRKGARAEEMIGEAIEYALTRDACAVAHHVEGIARVGDVDHLVATPRGLWVIETKHRRVPKSQFAETLQRIAVNVEGVRAWAGPGTRVVGCLVFANEEKPPQPSYVHGKETIRAFADRRALMRELRKEARGTGDSLDLARRVWKLGKLATNDQ